MAEVPTYITNALISWMLYLKMKVDNDYRLIFQMLSECKRIICNILKCTTRIQLTHSSLDVNCFMHVKSSHLFPGEVSAMPLEATNKFDLSSDKKATGDLFLR